MSTTTSSAASPAGEADLAQLRRRAVLSCLVGNRFELYDFGVYG